MVIKIYIFLITFQFIINASYEIEDIHPTDLKFYQMPVEENKVVLENIAINGNNTIYFQEYTIESQYTKKIDLNINKTNNFGYLIFQIHSYAYDIKLYSNLNKQKIFEQNGQNLGLVIFDNETLYIKNTLSVNISYVIAILSYDLNIPIPGGCNLEGDISISPNLIVKRVLNHNDMIQVDTPFAAMSIEIDPEQKLCSNAFNNSILNYVGLYRFLPKADFTKETYFLYIKNFLLPTNITKFGSMATKKNNNGPANRRVYLKIPGVGMIFNTIVRDLNGIAAAYVPTIKYFCNPFVWEEGCNSIFDNTTLTIISWIVIFCGFLKSFYRKQSMSGLYCDLVINTFTIGAYFTYKLLVYVDISQTLLVTIVIIAAILLTIFVIVLSIFIGPLILIVYITSIILFSGIFAIIAVYEINDVTTFNGSLYWTIFIITLVILLFSMCSQKVAILWLIINAVIGFSQLFFGFLFVLKSDLVYSLLMHFYVMQNTDYLYLNGQVSPSKSDVWLFVGVIGFVMLGYIFKTNKTCSRDSNSEIEYENDLEQRPLIRRWTNGSDEVFESPNTNNRLLRRLSQNLVYT